MMRSQTIIPALAICLIHCIIVVSSKGIPGYVFTGEKAFPNSLLKDTLKTVVYNDQDVKNLILHNLGMLNYNIDLSESAQGLISQYGSKSLIRQEKLNYVFLLEGGSSDATADPEKKVFSKTDLKHQTALFDVCNGAESKECLLNHLLDTEKKDSVISTIQAKAGKSTPEAFFYTSDYIVSHSFPKSTLTTAFDRNGNAFIMDHGSNKQFKIANNLNSCVNNLLKGAYVVDVEKRTITPTRKYSRDVEAPVLVAGEEAKDQFLQFMSDICSVVGVSTLIRKDPNPSFFVFHISSIGKLEKFLSEEENLVLYKIFNIAHEKLVKNIVSQYKGEEISGQVFLLSPENNLSSGEQNTVLIELGQTHFQQARVLAETSSTSGIYGADSTTNVIFQSTFIVFILVTAWVCFEMFNIDIQKDSVVYAKFLAADYFRR